MRNITLSLLVLLCSSCVKEATTEHTQSTTLQNGLIAHYPFDGDVKDISGNDYHLISNGVTRIRDRAGADNKAYYFNGTSAFMTIPAMDKANYLDSFSISIWIKPERVENQQEIFNFKPYHDTVGHAPVGISHQLSIMKNPTASNFYILAIVSKCEFYTYSTSCDGIRAGNQSTYNTNKWIHLVLSKKGRSLLLHIDGQPYTTILNTEFSPSFGLGGTLGKHRSNTNSGYYQGVMDDFRIYNRNLTDEEIQQLYQSL